MQAIQADIRENEGKREKMVSMTGSFKMVSMTDLISAAKQRLRQLVSAQDAFVTPIRRPVGVDVSAQVVTPPSLEDPKTLQMSSTLTCNTVFPTLCQLRIYIAVETRTHKHIKSKRDSTLPLSTATLISCTVIIMRIPSSA